ncbi:hypothetical protein SLS56_004754 [Neofusicoccum ribis]|uniref:C3H1-type domain-containing protein n=1 Tax=Neofusicoccum ribis TaxID=45134 RepID=A0ABR3SW94_9PEZI
MAPCKYFLQGNCKFGDRCRFDHPGAYNQNRSSNQQNQGQNRFAALNNANTGGQGGRGGQRVYAAARSTPRQLIEGPVMEQSPEEMRLRYYAAMQAGNPQQAVSLNEEIAVDHCANHEANQAQEESQLANQVNQQIQNILSDLNGACRYVQDGENTHPNRFDVCQQASAAPGQQPQQQQAGAFGRGNGAFGQPSAFGAAAKPPQTSAFGQPSAFGAATGQQQSAFGRPSAFGAAANHQSAFGSPSPLGGGAANPAFGKPAFGAPSAFGQAANAGSTAAAAPAFGQPSQPSAFGQPGGGAFGAKPAFGQPAGGSAFGQASQPGATGAFGKPTGTPGFGQPAFGQPAQPAANSRFGQLGQQQQQQQQPQQQAGGFGQPTNQQSGPSAFGQPMGQQPGPSAFGQPGGQQPANNAFGQPAAKPSPFGAPSQAAAPSAFGAPAPAATANPFGKPAGGAPLANGLAAPQANGFGQQPSANAGAPSVAAGADVSSYTTRGPNNQLTSWKGQPVQYMNGNPCYRRPDNGQWERIWLPDGAPPENPYSHAPREAYGEVLQTAYDHLNKTGTFKDGIMPEEPPMHELVGWDV